MASIDRTYTASPTLAKFHASNKRIRCVRGPVGSGKSVAMAVEMVRRAAEAPVSSDGVRRSKAVIVRNTLQQLKSTCLVTFMEWFRPIARYKVSDQTIEVRFTGADGVPVNCDIILLPLDTPENRQRLLSLELTFAWISEFREIPLQIMQDVYSRCGRYPSRANTRGEDYWYGLWAETNSFSEDSDYYTYLEVERPAMVDYFVQPGGMDPDAENREHLAPRYYEDLVESNDPAWVDQYVHNKIGPSLSGQAVFAASFSRDFHVAASLYPNYSKSIVIGVDTGRNPAAVFGQIDIYGRMLVFSSLWAENMGIEKFLNIVVRPHMAERFQGGRFFVSIDPAAQQRSQIGEKSVKEAVRDLGFSVVLAPTNSIAPRLRAVERYLNQQVDGKAGFLIDAQWNKDLIRALQHEYKYRRRREGDLEEMPDKAHPWSDLADALQYLCLGVGTNAVAAEIGGGRREIKPVPAAGWT